LKLEELTPSGFTKHSTKWLNKLLKVKCLILPVFIFAEVTGHNNGRSYKKGKRCRKYIFTFSVSQTLPVALQNNTWPMQASDP